MGCTCTQEKKGYDQQPRAKNYMVKEDQAQQNSKNPPQAQQQSQNKNQKPIKSQIQRKPQVPSQFYLRPYQLVELAVKDEPQFIKLMKDNNIKNLAHFTGYEADPPILLKTGRKANTYTWNPLTFALVMGKQDLFNFIFKDLNFNLSLMLGNNLNGLGMIQPNSPDDKDDNDGITQIFSLIIENDSILTKVVVNELAYLINNQNLKKLISIMSKSENAAKCLEILLQSKAMKQLYFQKVKSIAKYKNSFQQFFEKYLDHFCQDKQAIEVMQKQLILSPYSAGFGFYLIQNYKKCKDMFLVPTDQLIAKCYDIKEFDVYRLGKFTESDVSEMQKIIRREVKQNDQPFLSFLDEYQKKTLKRDQFEAKIATMFQKLVKGDLSGFKSKIGTSDIPKEALSLITGQKFDDITIKVEALNENYEIETFDLNALELASACGHSKIVAYITDDLQLKSNKDFQMQNKGGQVDQMQFIVGPILRKEMPIIQNLLSLYHLWNYDQYQAILGFMKSTKWFEGILTAMNSKTAHHLFINSGLQERFRFIRDHLILPFKIDNLDDSFQEQQNEDGVARSRSSLKKIGQTQKQQNSLKNEEKIKLRAIIKERFCKSPFTAAFLFQEFAQRRDTYKNVAETEIIAESTDKVIDYMTESIDNAEDYELHDYIMETQGNIVNIFNQYVDALSMNEELQEAQKTIVAAKFQEFIERLSNHPTMLSLRQNQEQANQV